MKKIVRLFLTVITIMGLSISTFLMISGCGKENLPEENSYAPPTPSSETTQQEQKEPSSNSTNSNEENSYAPPTSSPETTQQEQQEPSSNSTNSNEENSYAPPAPSSETTQQEQQESSSNSTNSNAKTSSNASIYLPVQPLVKPFEQLYADCNPSDVEITLEYQGLWYMEKEPAIIKITDLEQKQTVLSYVSNLALSQYHGDPATGGGIVEVTISYNGETNQFAFTGYNNLVRHHDNPDHSIWYSSQEDYEMKILKDMVGEHFPRVNELAP